MQHGNGLDSDGYYIYNQEGEGVGSFFSSLLRGVVPILAPIASEAIKGFAGKLGSKLLKHSSKNPRKRRRINRSAAITYPKRARI